MSDDEIVIENVMQLFFAWADEIVATCRERGVEARMWPKTDDGVLEYCWTTLDPPDDEERHRVAWGVVHSAMLLHEPLRPEFLIPSPSLHSLLCQGMN